MLTMQLKIIILNFNFCDTGDNMNLFLNENWEELLHEMQPPFEDALRSGFVSIAQPFFNRIPYNQIFTE